MFKIDLKRAEAAIDGGRLDDAFKILRASAQTKHANGQCLVDRLVNSFLERARAHLSNGNLNSARQDTDRAKSLGGDLIEVVRLQADIDAKWASAAGHARNAASENLLNQIQQLLDQNNHLGAVEWLSKQSTADRQRLNLIDLVAASASAIQTQAINSFDAGRLDRTQSIVHVLLNAGFNSPELEELIDQLDRCRLAGQEIARSDFSSALRRLRQVAQVFPKTSWIPDAVASVAECQNLSENLLAGPLGLIPAPEQKKPLQQKARPNKKNPIQPPNAATADRKAAINPFNACTRSVLQVDQLGSVLLAQGNVISIGTPSCSPGSDIVLQTEGLNEKITIIRDGEDYIVTSNAAFSVNQSMAKRHVLASNDTITVGNRGRLKYVRPVAASSTAVLTVQGAKLKRRDIRSIALIGDAVIFGSSNSHFAIPDMKSRVVLRPVEGDSKNEFLIHQKGDGQHQILAENQSLEICGVRFAINHSLTSGRQESVS